MGRLPSPRVRLRTGAPWRDLPERYGPWQTIDERFARWEADGTWARLLEEAQRADQKANRLRSGRAGGRPPAFDRGLYKARNVVERCFGRLKQSRAIATRFAKLAGRYRAGVHLAALILWLREPAQDPLSDRPQGALDAWGRESGSEGASIVNAYAAMRLRDVSFWPGPVRLSV
ncbi:hypothetical protein GCM10023082_02530 [Streptomyces tremellae]|uniref:Transposase n=1 Tax=Streptomyces tremellae TaxID=1124239 RepID=A0ABP7DRP1_9ACTN